MNAFKEKVQQHFRELLREKITVIRQKLDELQESLKGETKSTAGDKHETSRAMVHIEQENTGRQLAVLLQQQAELESFASIPATNGPVAAGHLVKTGMGYLYLTTGIGKAIVAGETVFALSPQSPLGQKLIGHHTGDCVEVKDTRYTIEAIC